MDSLLWKYFWCVPANTLEEYPSSSLYHHLRNSATIAAALYSAELSGQGKEIPFMIVAADLNGIQAYLYDLNQENSNKASKLLRSRSFQIQTIMEMAAHRTVHELSLSRLSVFSSLGGKWFLLAPNTEENREKLGLLKEELNSDIYKKYLGTVSLNMNWDTVIAAADLRKNFFLETMATVIDHLEQEKGHRFERALTSDGKWDSGRFIINSDEIYHDQICQFCRRRKSDDRASEEYVKYESSEEEGTKLCRSCLNEIRLGRNLVKTCNYSISHGEEGSGNAYISFAGMNFPQTRKKPKTSGPTIITSASGKTVTRPTFRCIPPRRRSPLMTRVE